ncbi:MAG: hypothetical protein U9R01_02045 [candidate division WOR-3 bacterium]|nr:hypothetical protein [candidate division WOR-3 bacterium]
MSRYNICTGLRRSGTSMLMLALRTAGIPIIGYKFSTYFPINDNQMGISCEPTPKLRNGNPNGYWEMGTITTETGLKAEHKDIGMDGDVIKIVCDALYRSDPELIDKVVLITRGIKNTIASQMKSKIFTDLEVAVNKNQKDFDKTIDWLKVYKKPYLNISYEELVRNPLNLKKVTDFLGKGDYKEGSKIIRNDFTQKTTRDYSKSSKVQSNQSR